VADLRRLGEADFNVVLYPEIAEVIAGWLKRVHHQPHTKVVPIGMGATREFIAEVAALAEVDAAPLLAELEALGARAPWYARSVDSTYLTGKRVFVFGDATHAVAAARVAERELGFTVVGLGTYSREFARVVRDAAKLYGVEALISDDYLEVEARIAELQPELVLGTQMERHIAKRLGIPCAVISAPVHVQDFPARYSPQMGIEGANVMFDAWVHPLMMGLEEHLLGMFKGDAEFHEDAAPSHLGRAGAPLIQAPTPAAVADAAPVAAVADAPAARLQPAPLAVAAPLTVAANSTPVGASTWASEAEAELKKIPFFVRGKARRNTERFAQEHGLSTITVETLYDAKAHFSR
jgi:light-independent protochlorophyllide reductase subunit B